VTLLCWDHVDTIGPFVVAVQTVNDHLLLFGVAFEEGKIFSKGAISPWLAARGEGEEDQEKIAEVSCRRHRCKLRLSWGMKQEILDLIHLNTYNDFSTNKASDTDINELLSKCGIALDENYLCFLKELNGFQIYKLDVYGVTNVWQRNESLASDYPGVKEYFVVGEGFEELYGYHLLDKKYYVLEFEEEDIIRGRGTVFEDFDSFLDWAIKVHAKRTSEQDPIIQKKSLLHITEGITTFLGSHNFKKTRGDVFLHKSHVYEREFPRAVDHIIVDIQVHAEMKRMFGRIQASKRYNLIEDFFDPEDITKTNGIVGKFATIYLSTDYYSNHRDEFSEQKVNEDPEALVSYFISFIETNISPALTLYDNIRVLDAKVNASLTSMGNIAASGYNGHYKMVIAKLAGNPIYDELYKFIVERFEKAIKDRPDGEKYRGYLEVTHKMNEKLRDVSPLKDGMLI
jgi:hypothetical protein